MIYSILENTSNAGKFFATLIIVILSLSIISFIGMIVGIAIFNVDLIQFENAINNIVDPENIKILKFLQLVQSVGLFIVPPFIVAWLFSSKITDYLKINVAPFVLSSIKVALIMILAMPLINFMAEINSMLKLPESLSWLEQIMKTSENNAQNITDTFLKVNNISGLFFNILLIAIMPAFGEELLFRGVFQKIFEDWTKNIHLGIIFSAFLFSAMHFQFYGFLPRFMMGVLFGYMFFWSGSLWLPIIAHFTNNLAAVLISYFMNLGLIGKEIETIGSKFAYWPYVLISAIIVTYLVHSVYLEHKRIL